jgi:hypothetical protein
MFLFCSHRVNPSFQAVLDPNPGEFRALRRPGFGDLKKKFLFSTLGRLLAPRARGSSTAPPCGTGLSAALKPRFAGLHPSGFHP